MTGKSIALTLALAAGLLAAPLAATAHDAGVKILHGNPADAVSVTTNEDGTGVTVVRGASTFVPRKTVAAEPVTYIDGKKIGLDNLEPVTDWFLDRSGENLVIVHCYTQQSLRVGGGRRILCDAREL
ncbi:hypothetical protein [Pelagibius marinus]|uniref:hypothetical protein n=1 Tax=Pelagibius marinus TaxID=2762760 RepID=UPI0018728C3F|nr:hypothetical protein [Pelagibius marinus]